MQDRWPFTPDHISNDKEQDGLRGTGILPNEELSGLQMVICANLRRATALVEFYGDEVPFKTNSLLTEHQFIPPCLLFRHCTQSSPCDILDTATAKLFSGLQRSSLHKDLVTVAAHHPPLLPLHKDSTPYTVGVYDDRAFLFYDCPYLGYRELLFPVFFESRVVAALFVGQLCIQNKQAATQRIRRHFFQTHQDVPSEADLLAAGMTREHFLSTLDQQDSDLWATTGHPGSRTLTVQAYQDLIRDTCHQLTALEEQLRQRVDHRRERFALARISEELSGLHTALPQKISLMANRPLAPFWSALDARMTRLADDFDLRYIALFTKDKPVDVSTELLPLVAYANNPQRPDFYKRPQDTLSFRSQVFPCEAKGAPTCSDQHPQLLDGLPPAWAGGRNPKNTTVLTYPIPFHPEAPLVVALGHPQGLGPTAFEYLHTAMESFEAAVVSIVASILQTISEQTTVASFRVLRHEIQQQTDGLKRLVQSRLGSGDSIRQLTEQSAAIVCSDTYCYLDQIDLLFRKARQLVDMLSGKFKLQREPFYAYGPLFHKWKDLYRYELAAKGRDMPLSKAEYGDDSRPKLFGDKMHLEQMLYNLIDNAVKYSYFGTRIHADCGVSADGSEYFFSVKDFGRQMPDGADGERCYELFERGSEATGQDGVGIGLTLARAVARAHGGELSHTCRQVCAFNVPLIAPYLHYVRAGEITATQEAVISLQAAERELASGGRLSEIVSRELSSSPGTYYPLPQECADQIANPTFEVHFTAVIPHGKGVAQS